MKIADMTTKEIVNMVVFAQKNWDDSYSKQKLLEMSRKEIGRRCKALLEMMECRPEQLVTGDGEQLLKNVFMKEY